MSSLLTWHPSPATFSCQGSLHHKAGIGKGSQLPSAKQRRRRIPNTSIWGCLRRGWKGVEAFHLRFNKVVARVGTACSLGALQAFHSTPTIYWSLSTAFAFPRHTGGITERTKGKNLVLFWKHSQSKHQFHSPAALHMM